MDRGACITPEHPATRARSSRVVVSGAPNSFVAPNVTILVTIQAIRPGHEKPDRDLSPCRAIVFPQWACEELNLGPHAYQAWEGAGFVRFSSRAVAPSDSLQVEVTRRNGVAVCRLSPLLSPFP